MAETVSGQGLVDNLEVNLDSGMYYFKVEGVDGAFGADEDFWLYIRSSSNLADFNFSQGDPYDNFTGATGKRWPEEAIPLKYFIDETVAPPRVLNRCPGSLQYMVPSGSNFFYSGYV